MNPAGIACNDKNIGSPACSGNCTSVVAAAVWARDFAPTAGKDEVMAAVSQDGGLLKHVGEALRADRDVVRAAVASLGRALTFAAPALKADRSVVLAAVAQDGNVLFDAAPELRADKALVLVAVAQHGYALRYASEDLKADKEVVLAAVRHSGHVLRLASDALRRDREVVTAAVAQNSQALASVACPRLKTDAAGVLLVAVASARSGPDLRMVLFNASAAAAHAGPVGDSGRLVGAGRAALPATPAAWCQALGAHVKSLHLARRNFRLLLLAAAKLPPLRRAGRPDEPRGGCPLTALNAHGPYFSKSFKRAIAAFAGVPVGRDLVVAAAAEANLRAFIQA